MPKRVAATVLCVRFSPWQMRTIRAKAQQANVSLSEYVRLAALRSSKVGEDETTIESLLGDAACSA